MRLFETAAVIVFSLLLSVVGFTQVTLDEIYEKGKIVIGTTGSQPPFSMTTKSDSLIGYEIEIARNLAEAMGVEVEFKIMTFDELLPAVTSGEIDAAMSGITMTVSRNKGVVFVGPYSYTGKSLLVTKKTLKKLDKTNNENIGEFKLTALKGSTSEQFVKDEFKGAQAIYVETIDEAIKSVQDGTSDALVADFPTCVVAALQDSDKKMRYLEEPINMEPIGMAISTTDVRLINLIQNYLYFLDSSNQIEKLEDKWYDQGEWLEDTKF